MNKIEETLISLKKIYELNKQFVNNDNAIPLYLFYLHCFRLGSLFDKNSSIIKL